MANNSQINTATKQAVNTTPAPTPAPTPTPTAAPVAQPEAAASVEGSGVVKSSSTSTPGAVDTPVVAKTVVQTGVFSSETQTLIDAISGDATVKAGFAQIEQYLKDMAPGKINDPTTGARHQVELFRTVQMLLNTVSNNFPRVLGTLLKVFDDYSTTTLGGQYVFRFTEELVLNNTDREAFHRIINLLLVTAEAGPARKSTLKTVDVARSLEYGVTDDARTKIQTFFASFA